MPALPLGFHPIPGEVGCQEWPAQCRHSSSTAASALGVTGSAPKTLIKSLTKPLALGRGLGGVLLNWDREGRKGKAQE